MLATASTRPEVAAAGRVSHRGVAARRREKAASRNRGAIPRRRPGLDRDEEAEVGPAGATNTPGPWHPVAKEPNAMTTVTRTRRRAKPSSPATGSFRWVLQPGLYGSPGLLLIAVTRGDGRQVR